MKQQKYIEIMLREKLTQILKNTNLSQGEIARQIGVHRQQITNWKNGSSKIPFERLEQICKIVGCKISVELHYT
jgi:transcriptional regulator with XRE-family HTH domain